jgi:RNA polymerase sigma-70 factor (ECF subfamily)
MDTDSASWVAALGGRGPQRSAAQTRLHELLLKVGMQEAYRRGPAARIRGQELEDLAHQAADDAMVSLLGKLDTFRGESRFTTWAYRFVVLEVSSKLGRHFWRRPAISLDAEEWDRVPSRFGADPLDHAQQGDLIAAVRRAIDEVLTARQRELFVAVVVNGVSTDAMAARSGSSPGAIYKTVFDARRKIRAYLTANGYLEGEPGVSRAAAQQVGVVDREQLVGVGRTVPGRRSA